MNRSSRRFAKTLRRAVRRWPQHLVDAVHLDGLLAGGRRTLHGVLVAAGRTYAAKP
jgi:hypothetical protein